MFFRDGEIFFRPSCLVAYRATRCVHPCFILSQCENNTLLYHPYRSSQSTLFRKHHVLRSTSHIQTPNLATAHLRYKSTDNPEEIEKRQKHQLALDANFDEDPEKASGKTVVNILNQETEDGIFFTSYSCLGFRISNGMRVMGPCAVFPRSILHWNVSTHYRNLQSVNNQD